MTAQKGFAAWRPNKKYAALLPSVLDTMEHYRDYWPLTQRSWLYRLMSRHWSIWSSKKMEKELEYLLGRGRRAGLIPWPAIAAGRGLKIEPDFYDDWHAMVDAAVQAPKYMPLDRQRGQARRLLLWIETEGMVSLVEGVAQEYGAILLSGGGFDTLTNKHDIAELIAREGSATILHVGDLDASGECLHQTLFEDLNEFVQDLDGDLQWERIAALDEHIDQFDLHWTEPVSDQSNHDRFMSGHRCVQAEAIPPDALQEIIRDAFKRHLDMDVFNDVMQDEKDAQQTALEHLSAVSLESDK